MKRRDIAAVVDALNHASAALDSDSQPFGPVQKFTQFAKDHPAVATVVKHYLHGKKPDHSSADHVFLTHAVRRALMDYSGEKFNVRLVFFHPNKDSHVSVLDSSFLDALFKK